MKYAELARMAIFKSQIGHILYSWIVRCGVVCGLVLPSMDTMAISFGIYESRAAGMGGVGVAAGNFENAIFYNPALLSFHDKREDESRDGRFFIPVVSGQYYEDIIKTFEDVEELKIEDRLDDAVAAFNLDQLAGANGVGTAVSDLETVLDQIGNEDVIVDAFLGLYVSEPAKREGGSFYIGTRVVGGARADVTEADRGILADYRTLMNAIEAGAESGPELEYLRNADGDLINPTDSITSRYDIGGIVITEVGVALSKEFNVYGMDIAFGITPKGKRVQAYRVAQGVANTDLDVDDDTKTEYSANADFGVAIELQDRFRIGLAVKDVISESFTSTEGSPDVQLKPRSRLGLAYVTQRFMVGLDLDILENAPVAGESPSQDWGLGFEYNPIGTLDLRLGYKQDMLGERDDVVTAGFGWSLGFFAMEAAYMESREMVGGALQFGVAF